jgi:hypothetical protein
MTSWRQRWRGSADHDQEHLHPRNNHSPENERAFINLLYNNALECYNDVITSPLISLLGPPLAELAIVNRAKVSQVSLAGPKV